MRRGQVVAVETLLVTVAIIIVAAVIATYIIAVSIQARSQPEINVLNVASTQFLSEDGSSIITVIGLSVYSRGSVDSTLEVITLFNREGSVDLNLASAYRVPGTNAYKLQLGSLIYYVELDGFDNRTIHPFSSSSILITIYSNTNPYVPGVSYLALLTFDNYFTWVQYTPLGA